LANGGGVLNLTNTSEPRLKVLLSAFALSPVRGSEAAVGWHIAIGLAKHVDVVVLHGDVRADRRGKREMEVFLRSHNLPGGLTVKYISPSLLMVLLEKLHTLPCCWMFYYLAYKLWQQKALKNARALHLKIHFDVCHQLTYIGYREPGNLWKTGIPFVWGPVSGAENIPRAFYRHFRKLEFFRPLSRDLGNIIQQAFPGRCKMAAKAASKVFAVSPSERELFARWGVTAECLLETGTTPSPLARVRSRRSSAPLRIVWSGLFTPRKALPLLLHALGKVNNNDWLLTVIGDGPSKRNWFALARSLGFTDAKIEWLGQLPRDQALQAMSEGDVLAHTGMREGTPHVVLEALSMGLPVICHDAGGMSTAITDKCGIKVPLVDPHSSIEGFFAAIGRFLNEKDLVQILSTGAITRAKELSWNNIIARFVDTYRGLTH
jgi:glycosyltransferase involved in cell wall biosynthesis